MATEPIEQAQRPLAEVDAAVERIQSSSRGSESDGPMQTARQAAEQAVQRVTVDGRAVAFLAVALTTLSSVILVSVYARGRQPHPPSAEDILLERSREALDQSRDAFEAAIARLASTLER